jgi:O-antigen/teichoic acid export membrane protein
VLLAQVSLIAVGFAIKHYQTNGLSPEDFGNYTFVSSFVAFCVIFFQFGYIPTLKLVLAQTGKDNESKEIIGLGFIITLILGLIFSQFVLMFSFFVDDIFDTHLGRVMLVLSPLFFSFMFIHFFNAIGIGSGKPKLGVLFELISRILFLSVIFYYFSSNNLTILNLVLYNCLSIIITLIVFYFLIKPNFNNLKASWARVKRGQKEFGKDYYLGSIANQSSFKLDDLMIAAWVNPIQLGFYSLARLLTSPIGMASTALNNALFKKYSTDDKISKTVLIINASIAILGVLIINFIASDVILLVFGTEYMDSANYILIFSLAFLFMALYQPFNFLTAKGKGNVVRNTAYAEALINILGNLILIPLIGLMGALVTTLAARFTHFSMITYYYYIYLQELPKP